MQPLHISLNTAHSWCKPSSSIIFIIIIIIIIKNISPRKLIDEPQMRLCSSHLSNKNVFSNFRNESKLKDGSFILVGRLFQIAHVIFYTFSKFSCPFPCPYSSPHHLYISTIQADTQLSPFTFHMPNHLNLPRLTTSAMLRTPKRLFKTSLCFLSFRDAPHIIWNKMEYTTFLFLLFFIYDVWPLPTNDKQILIFYSDNELID